MKALEIDLYKSLKRYYNHLFNTGYSKNSDIEKMLVYLFIEEIFEYSLVPYVSRKDYITIGKALNCLYGSTCALPHPDLRCSSYFLTDVLNPLNSNTRITEDNISRISEDIFLRKIK